MAYIYSLVKHDFISILAMEKGGNIIGIGLYYKLGYMEHNVYICITLSYMAHDVYICITLSYMAHNVYICIALSFPRICIALSYMVTYYIYNMFPLLNLETYFDG